MSEQTTEDAPGFYLHVDGPFLCCLRCGKRTRIERRPWARDEAEAAHICGLGCGCWSSTIHEATRCEVEDDD